MTTTRLPVAVRTLRHRHSVESLVNKKCARKLWELLASSPPSLEVLFDRLLTMAAESMTSLTAETKLARSIAAIWELARWGYHWRIVRDKPAPRVNTQIRCRRTQLLSDKAMLLGDRIAKNTCNQRLRMEEETETSCGALSHMLADSSWGPTLLDRVGVAVTPAPRK